jgi:arabinogalactan oligomer/maltooligosaccharide transport system substrate-binding protein
MKKLLLLMALAMVVLFTAAGCGGKTPLTIWVGSESEAFYTAKMEEYKALYLETTGEEFPHEIAVKGVDTGTAASTFLDDTEAGADIFTAAHDNLGKLIAGSSSVAPVQSQALLDQIQADNPASFLEVIKGTVNGTEYTFGIPYIAQSLVLYYNKAFITETQAQTWEGILEAAVDNNKQALSLAGTDGFNNSFILLATEAETGDTSLKLYENGVQENCFGTGDDTIAKLKWGQNFFNHPNGAKAPTDSGWEVELKDEISISFIGGAWHYSAAKAALGDDLGITILPTFTIDETEAYGDAVTGTVYQSGTFADTKAFFMKKGSAYQEYLEDILLFLTSKDVQEESFEQVQNLPAYKNAADEFAAFQEDTLDAQLAAAQVRMFEFGIPQPFGFSSKFNTYYYSKGAPELILEILKNPNGNLTTHEAILAQMQKVESLWKTGLQPQ